MADTLRSQAIRVAHAYAAHKGLLSKRAWSDERPPNWIVRIYPDRDMAGFENIDTRDHSGQTRKMYTLDSRRNPKGLQDLVRNALDTRFAEAAADKGADELIDFVDDYVSKASKGRIRKVIWYVGWMGD